MAEDRTGQYLGDLWTNSALAKNAEKEKKNSGTQPKPSSDKRKK
jgi:hypothetical protein